MSVVLDTMAHIYIRFMIDTVTKKRKAYDWCYEQYLDSDNHDAFSIISHNSFGFSVSWLCTIDGHDGMRIETPKNSYFIDFEE